MRRLLNHLATLVAALATLLFAPLTAQAHGSTMGEGLRLSGANPFRGGTTLSFRLNHSMKNVELVVYDAAGRRVAELLNGPLEAGEHRQAFSGRGLPTGTYFARLRTEHGLYEKRLVLIP